MNLSYVRCSLKNATRAINSERQESRPRPQHRCNQPRDLGITVGRHWLSQLAASGGLPNGAFFDDIAPARPDLRRPQ